MPQSFEDFSNAGPMRRAPTVRREQSLYFLILGQRVQIDCVAPAVQALLTDNFSAMAAANDEGEPADLRYTVNCTGTAFSIVREGQEPLTGVGLSDLLYLMEKDLTVEVQKRRSELLFLHSAAVEWKGKAYLFAAESGSGKSTTTWALLHHGFRYLSDELSPVDLDSLAVLPYPHALCLKQPPPVPYELPERAIHLGRTIHIPAEFLPDPGAPARRPIGAVLLLTRRPGLNAPHLRELGRAEASARLYVTALNLLAHPNHGLDAVMQIAERAPCFALESADLSSTCALIRSVVAGAHQRTASRESPLLPEPLRSR
jgi:hypothetical protein